MRGVVATVTSCIGGKDEKFAVKVTPAEHSAYFVYKSLHEFEAIWQTLEDVVAELKKKTSNEKQGDSLLAKWLVSFVDHYAFRSIIQQLRAQGKETMTTLNVFLQLLVRRVAALYVENTILRCGCCPVGRQLALLVRNFLEFTTHVKADSPRWRKRQFSEMRPEDEDACKRSAPPMFPTRVSCPTISENDSYDYDRSIKARKMSVMENFTIPPIRKVDLNLPPVPSRRRVFAEVEFNI